MHHYHPWFISNDVYYDETSPPFNYGRPPIPTPPTYYNPFPYPNPNPSPFPLGIPNKGLSIFQNPLSTPPTGGTSYWNPSIDHQFHQRGNIIYIVKTRPHMKRKSSRHQHRRTSNVNDVHFMRKHSNLIKDNFANIDGPRPNGGHSSSSARQQPMQGDNTALARFHNAYKMPSREEEIYEEYEEEEEDGEDEEEEEEYPYAYVDSNGEIHKLPDHPN